MDELQAGPVAVEGEETDAVESVRAELELAFPIGYGGGKSELLVEGCLTVRKAGWLGARLCDAAVDCEGNSEVDAAFLSS